MVVHSMCLHLFCSEKQRQISVVTTELGYERVSPEQRLVIESFLKRQDVFVSLPTGTEKSLCYPMGFKNKK